MSTTKYELVQIGEEIISPYDGVGGHSTFVSSNNIFFATNLQYSADLGTYLKLVEQYDPDSSVFVETGSLLPNTSSSSGKTYSNLRSFSVTDDLIAATVVEYIYAAPGVSKEYNSYLKVLSADDGSEVYSVLLRSSGSQSHFDDTETQFLSSGKVAIFDESNGVNNSSAGTAPVLYIVNPATGSFETVNLSGHDVLTSNGAEIVELANGNILVAYKLDAVYTRAIPDQFRASIVTPDGQLLVEDADLLPDSSVVPDAVVEIEALPSGGFVVASEKHLQFFDSSGASVGDPVMINSDLHADLGSVIIDSMTVASDGFVVLTLSTKTGGNQPNISLIFDFEGNMVGDPQDSGLRDWGFREYAGYTGEVLGALESGELVFANDRYNNSASLLFDINAIAQGSIAVSGELFVEDVLSVTPNVTDEDGIDDSSWTYQWYIAETSTAIQGATSASFELTPETAGQEVYVEASFADLLGNVSTFTSDASGTITGVFSAEASGSRLVGTALSEIFNGAGGDDTILANGGNDTIAGGAGSDEIRARAGRDNVQAGEGNDTIYGDAHNDSLYGGTGDDLIFGGSGKDKLFGEDGDDVLSGGNQNDLLEGGAGSDTLTGDGGKDRLFGGAGDDELSGGAKNDQIYGGEGADVLAGDGGKDRLFGGAGDDVLLGGGMNDVLNGDAGADTLTGHGGKDKLFGGAGDDNLSGGGKNDRLFGEDGADLLLGDTGRDVLSGGAGNDTLDGGRQNDVLTGGADADTFMMDIGYKGRNTITDFECADTLLFYKKSQALGFDAETFVNKFATETSDGVVFNFGRNKQLLVEGVLTVEELVDNISFDYL